MAAVLSKRQMTEEDIKLQFITPAITKKWALSLITMETRITDGQINLRGNMVSRKEAKKADYILYLNESTPIAIVEAKDNKHAVGDGLQQAMQYAIMMDIPFAYSSNGDGFMEHDFLTGEERSISMEDFPAPDALYARFKAGANHGEGLTQQEESVIRQPFYSGQNTYPPRYYQRNAVNRTLDAIARGQDRILLVMATGTGKTYTAFQIVYRLLKSGMKKKILYLADRNILVDQSIQQDFAPLEKTIHKVNFVNDDPLTITSHEIFFSLYQQLAGKDDDDTEDGDETVERLAQLFSKDFFDLVIVDECHRGSAKKESNWRKILEYFSSATQIGMTATPKETKYVSNIDYFGEPVYVYSLKDGIEDGFLAPFKVINITTDIGDGWRPWKGQLDIYGHEIPDRIYNNRDYDYNIIIEDRIVQVAKEITDYLKATDRMSKTIVFCATEDAALRMRNELARQNPDMMQKYPDYVVRITGNDTFGKDKLDYFISVGSKTPVIATTSKLLSTGADCKMTKLIVLDEWINSMTEFKQIIGRGTRIREKDGKTHFIVMDIRGVTALFADPDWDGPIEIDEDYGREKRGPCPSGPKPNPDPDPVDPPYPPEEQPIVDENGCRVRIINKTVSVYDTNGKLLRQESIVDYTKTNIIGTYASLDNFIRQWTSEEKKKKIQELLASKGIDLEALKADQHMSDVDDFDFICHVAFDKKPLTRKERANNVKKRDFLSKYSGVAREVLEALLDQYMNVGIYELAHEAILTTPQFAKFGKIQRIFKFFGGEDKYNEAVHELENELYEAG